MTYTVSGTISGLGPGSGLMLLNKGGDATTVAANSTAFTMKTPVASGAAYEITVGRQPYGLTLACSVSDGNGTATANVTSIAVSCSNVTPTQKAVAGYFESPRGVAVDAGGNLFVADTWHSAVKEIPYSGGSYGAPITLGSGFDHPFGVAVDSSGNVFVADSGNDAVKEIPYSGGNYGDPVTLASGFLTSTEVEEGLWGPTGIGVSASGDVLVLCNGVLDRIPFNGGSYGAPVIVSWSVSSPQNIAVDAMGDVFVTDALAVYEVHFNGGSYGATVTLASGFNYPPGVAVDAVGNVFVTDAANYAVKEIPFSGGSYGAPVNIASNLSTPYFLGASLAGIAVDKNGNVFVANSGSNAILEFPFKGSSYGTQIAVGSGFSNPAALAVDANDNLFIADTSASVVQELAYDGSSYHTAISLGTIAAPLGMAVGASGNVFVAVSDQPRLALTEISYIGGAYQKPVYWNLFLSPQCVTVDANDDLFVVDDNDMSMDVPVKESLFTGYYYQTPVITLGTALSLCSGIAVDANRNVFITTNGGVYELPFNGSSYGATTPLNAGSGNFRGMAVDTNSNVFVADRDNGVVKEIPFNGSSYGNPITLGSGFDAPFGVAVDKSGRLFVLDNQNIWRLGPD
jgi:sugar lactone lactonase YvrE